MPNQSNRHCMVGRLAAACAVMMFGSAPAMAAEPVDAAATPQIMSTVEVTASARPRADVPAVVERTSAEQLSRQNIADAADTLRYFPNLQVRQRYIGDPNAIISGRNAGTLQSARSLVYMDGLLLSNFMTNGWNGAPRWGVVSTSSINAVDVQYGPYSALYPGNSIGNTVLIQTRLPDRFSAGASVQYFSQDFRDAYGASDRYDGHQIGAFIGNGHGRWRWQLSVDQLDNHGQPMEYATAKPGGDLSAATAVTGATLDRNPTGSPRLVYGARDMQHSRQTQATLQATVDLSEHIHARFTIGGWHDRSDETSRSFLRDSSGQPVYVGTILIDGKPWTLPDGGLAPTSGNRTHVLLGAQIDGCQDNGWCWNATVSRYDFQRDSGHVAASSLPESGQGTLADMGGSGWDTFDLRTSGPLGNHHTLYAGAHFDRYQLDTKVHATSDWRGDTNGALTRAYQGNSATRALYLQDIWDFAPGWVLTLGLRWEQWRAYGGALANATSRLEYPARQRSDWSPKASVSWHFAAPWELRLSFGKAVRYPTVEELFQGSLSGNAIVNNNPNLAPERDWSTDLSLIRTLRHGHWRVSLFQDRFADTLYSQTDITLPVPVTSVQNIASVRMRGIEGALELKNVLPNIDLDASIAFNDATTLRDTHYPLADGKAFPRIPRLRASVFADWRFAPDWDVSLGVRRSGHQYGTLDNRDFIDTYGAVSSFTVADAKLRWRFAPQWTASLGVNNLTNARYWVYHPYAGRTWFGEIQWKL